MHTNRLKNLQPTENGAPSNLGESAKNLGKRLEPMAQYAGEFIARTIRRQPLAAVVIGLATGVTLGCLVKRR